MSGATNPDLCYLLNAADRSRHRVMGYRAHNSKIIKLIECGLLRSMPCYLKGL